MPIMRPIKVVNLLFLVLLLRGMFGCGGSDTAKETTPDDAGTAEGDGPPPRWILAATEMPRGLVRNQAGTAPGYVLFSQFSEDLTYLVDGEGQVVYTWQNEKAAGSHYLQDDGHLVRLARMAEPPNFKAGGVSGYLQELS